MDILIIKPQWGTKILNGEKVWEIRGFNTKKRGTIAIAFSRTSKKHGQATLINTIELTEEMWNVSFEKHCISGMTWEDLLDIYKHPFAWVFESPLWYENPIPFTPHPGAVIWVKE
jgi:hypothetical protein